MAFVFVVVSRKGGVGKSTITVNFCATMAEVLAPDEIEITPAGTKRLAPVAAVSVDPQGSTAWWADRVGDNLPFVFAEAYDDLDDLKRLREATAVDYVVVDTPGWYPPEARDDNSGDPIGEGRGPDAIRAALDNADHVIVPIETEPMSWEPTVRTIEDVIKPRGLPYTVVVSNWDPRDGEADRDDTKKFARSNGWPVAKTVIRHYKLHAKAGAVGQVVTQYPKSRIAQECLQDFTNLALEMQMRTANDRRNGAER
ncbi:ParA family protein [Kitasatospora sp. NPDC096128]|uniref:ParA family protein n=1 Tax=Kitasatospora sp. NPDC096128 TaxID=3155547 RepID=UPI00332B0245